MARRANGSTAVLEAVRPPDTPKRRASPQEQIASALAASVGGYSKRSAALTASAEVLDPAAPQETGAGSPNAVTRTWQHAAWGYMRSVGELMALVMKVGNIMSRAQLVPGQIVNGTIQQAYTGDEPAESVDPKVAAEVNAIISQIKGPMGRTPEILRKYGECMFVIGEGYLIPEDATAGTAGSPADVSKAVVYEFVSTQELIRNGSGGWTRYYGPGYNPKDLPKDTKPIRIWRQDPQYCADEETEILTAEGWRQYTDLAVGDLVLALDHETGLSGWEPVEAVNIFEARNQDMTVLRSKVHSSMTTGAHRWPVLTDKGARVWRTSETLKAGDRIIRSAPSGDAPTDQKWTDAFVELVAWYWTEGTGTLPSQGVTIGQSHRVNAGKVASIRRALTELFGPATTDSMQSGWRPPRGCAFPGCERPHKARGLCNSHDAQRAHGLELRPVRRWSKSVPAATTPEPSPLWCERLDGEMTLFALNAQAAAELHRVAPNKVVAPGFLREMTRSQLDLFIEKSIDADGSRDGVHESLAQSDRARADAFGIACTLAGRSATVRQTSAGTWLVSLQRAEVAHIHGFRRNGQLPTENYTGKVWCPTTRSGSWFARRDGTSYFTGNSKLSSSSVRACLEILEELVVLTRLVRAAAISRMALAGILLLPDEIDSPDDDTQADGSQSEEKNPVAVDMINTASKAVDDPSAAAAFMPFILQAPAEMLKEVRHVAFQGDDQENVIKRDEAVTRLARSLDAPAESILGHQSTTYANAAQVSQDEFNLHFEPLLEMFCDALTVAVLWPAMALARSITPERIIEVGLPDDITQWCVTYNANRMISRPDRAKDIINVFIHDPTQMAVGILELREALGLSPDNAPDDKEIAKRIDAIRLGKIREVIHAPTDDAAVPVADASAGKAPVPGSSAGEAILEGDEGAGEMAVRAHAVAEVVIERAIERVGAKLRTKIRGRAASEAERAACTGVASHAIPRVLGETPTRRILGDAVLRETLATEMDALARGVERWARQLGFAKPSAVAHAVREMAADVAVCRLYNDRVDLPNVADIAHAIAEVKA